MKTFYSLYAKHSVRIGFLLLMLLVPIVTFGMFQDPGTVIPPASLPFILFVPYLLGIVLHWAKKYMADGLNLNLASYLVGNLIGTIISIVVGLSSLATMYASEGHGGLYPLTLASWIAAFWVGVGADTINSGMTKNKPQ